MAEEGINEVDGLSRACPTELHENRGKKRNEHPQTINDQEY